MRTIAAILLSGVVLGAQTPSRRVIEFESEKAGQAPSGFVFALTGSGRPGAWTVRRDEAFQDHGNVLAQTDADPTSYRFPLAIVDDTSTADVDISVRFLAVSGRVDQAADLIWRYRDANNYYILRGL
jgi:hypothetical protein